MLKTISVVPALQIAGAYVAADCVGGPLTFPISTDTMTGRSLTIRRIVIIDADVEDAELYLHIFDAAVTATTDTDADQCLPAAADLLLKLCTIHVAAADYMDSTGDSIVTNELDVPINYTGPNLIGVLECVGTPQYTAVDDLLVRLVVEL